MEQQIIEDLPAVQFDADSFSEQIRQAGIDPAGRFVSAVCIGIRPGAERDRLRKDFRLYAEKVLAVYEEIQDRFRENGWGFTITSNELFICMAGFIAEKDGHACAQRHLDAVLNELEERYEVPLFAGVGITVDEPAEFEKARKSAVSAFQAFYFNPARMIALDRKKFERKYTAIDDYFERLEQAFRAILVHDPLAAEKLTGVVDVLREFHYGNRQAMLMHTMEYTGVIAMRLNQYRLLETDFFELQNSLQEKVSRTTTYAELRGLIYDHFAGLLPLIFASDRPKAKLVIEQVKEYVREHFMEEITVEMMAEFSHFSADYFSHLFKKETGKNFKAFLTELRMKRAVEFLRDTEYRIADISEKVGYNNPRAFGEAFRQTYSVSPMEYRRISRKNRRY